MYIIAIAIIAAVLLVLFVSDREHQAGPDRRRTGREDSDWQYGDVWKEGSPDEPLPVPDERFVEVLRGDTGRGFDDSVMLDMVGFLGSRGIPATYDSFSIGLEPAAMKTYVLKVEEGREQEALEILKEKVGGQSG